MDNMTDKEFKRLNRAQLIDIIYQFQLQIDKLTEQNLKLKRELADKRLRLRNAGNIADAALEINNCFRSAQDAADQYLNEIKLIRDETEAERQRILARAQAAADAILADAKKARGDDGTSIEKILDELEQNHSDNG
jgi:cell division septum initiation protein DivIVA